MRFAFVTTEFPVSRPGGGGLASYSARMTRLLAEAGHQVEIFVPVDGVQPHLPAEMDWNGCRLHHVSTPRVLLSRGANRMLRLIGLPHLAARRYWLSRAKAVGAAVDRVQVNTPFDVVHSADSYGIGLGITAWPGRLRVVRCSAAMDLYMDCDGHLDRRSRTHVALEEAAIAGADLAFAPSRLTARHYSRKLGREVLALPTPVYLDVPDVGAVPEGTPPRYLMHFANDLIGRKGTDLIAEALPLALAEAPDLTLLWVGRIEDGLHRRLVAQMGPAARRVSHLPRQDRSTLYALIQGAVCTVLPSRIDNLPNAVLESLMLGTPVIGSNGSSIEELVEEGVTGTLIANGSAPDLAAAMVRAWRGDLALHSAGAWMASPTGRAFHPETALAAYLTAINTALDTFSRSPGVPFPAPADTGPAAPPAGRHWTVVAAGSTAPSAPAAAPSVPAPDADGA